MALIITPNLALVIENVPGENGNADTADGGAQLLADVDIMCRLIKETKDRTHETATPPEGSGFTQDEWTALRRATERWQAKIDAA